MAFSKRFFAAALLANLATARVKRSCRPTKPNTVPDVQLEEPKKNDGIEEAEKKCIFPFTVDGKTYNSCGARAYSEDGGRSWSEYASRAAWCSTKVDEKGEHIWSKGDTYVICDKEPELVNSSADSSTPECIFPFTANGKTYESCGASEWSHDGVTWWTPPSEDAHLGIKWCSTKVDENGEHIWSPGGETYKLCNKGGLLARGPVQAQARAQDKELEAVNSNKPEEKECIFPFTVNGKTYESCGASEWSLDGVTWGTSEDSHFGIKWCSTKVDESGNHIWSSGGETYKYCNTGDHQARARARAQARARARAQAQELAQAREQDPRAQELAQAQELVQAQVP